MDKLDDIYNIGTFCQVTEMRNVDDKLRLVLLGHRRIKITDISKPSEPKKTEAKAEEKAEAEEEKPESVEYIVQVMINRIHLNSMMKFELSHSEKIFWVVVHLFLALLQVETDNLKHDPFKQNDEVKALSGEIVKTFRDIIKLNPLYKESIQLLVDSGKQVRVFLSQFVARKIKFYFCSWVF